MFGWREIFTTFSLRDFTQVREALEQGGVDYRYDVRNMIGSMRSAGSIGFNMDYDKLYLIRVNKKNIDQAQYLISNARKRG